MPIPVLYYHSIANHKKKVPWSFLSFPYNLFEKHLKYLSKKNYTTISLDELYFHMINGKNIPKNSIVITFDDGFLDNWVFALPLLKKYKMKATIYINPDFVDNRSIVRKTLEDVWNDKLTIDELDWWGYLSWDELKIMEDSGIMDIQSHALTHTWYFSNENIIDFHNPNSNYYWLYWNDSPERKPFWLKEYSTQVINYGRPVYEHKKALICRKYYEDEGLKNFLIKFVAQNGGESFFLKNNWKSILYAEVDKYKAKNKLNDSFESEQNYLKRIKDELSKSKQIIETELSKTVKYLCWPGGGQTDLTFKMAYETGYISTTKGIQLNTYGSDPSRISRLAGVSPFQSYSIQKLISIYFLKIQLKRGQGKFIGKIFGRFLRLLYNFLKASQ